MNKWKKSSQYCWGGCKFV